MKEFVSLFLVASFFVAVPVLAFEGTLMIGDDQFTAPIGDSETMMSDNEDESNSDEEAILQRSGCPRGFDRVASHRWNFRKHRWEFAEWVCRHGRN